MCFIYHFRCIHCFCLLLPLFIYFLFMWSLCRITLIANHLNVKTLTLSSTAEVLTPALRFTTPLESPSPASLCTTSLKLSLTTHPACPAFPHLPSPDNSLCFQVNCVLLRLTCKSWVQRSLTSQQLWLWSQQWEWSVCCNSSSRMNCTHSTGKIYHYYIIYLNSHKLLLQ